MIPINNIAHMAPIMINIISVTRLSFSTDSSVDVLLLMYIISHAIIPNPFKVMEHKKPKK